MREHEESERIIHDILQQNQTSNPQLSSNRSMLAIQSDFEKQGLYLDANQISECIRWYLYS